jgi:hypothetical protein
MAESRFTVEPGALRQLAGSLASLSSTIEDATRATKQVDTSGFGSNKLADAAGHFVTHWSWQAQQISTTAAEVGKRLNQAADQYDSVEQNQLAAQGQGTTA